MEEGCHSINTLAGQFGSSLWEWIRVQAAFDRVFWSFRLDCKVPQGRDQVVGFPPCCRAQGWLRFPGQTLRHELKGPSFSPAVTMVRSLCPRPDVALL